MIIVKNVSNNRSVVCTLKDGTSLRLLPKSEVSIKDNQMTDYLKNLSKQPKPIVVVRQAEKESVIEKEEVKKSTLKKADEKPVKENKEVK